MDNFNGPSWLTDNPKCPVHDVPNSCCKSTEHPIALPWKYIDWWIKYKEEAASQTESDDTNG